MAVRFLNGLTSSNSTDRPDIVSNIPFIRKHDASGDYLSSIDNFESFILSKIDGGYGGGTKASGSHNGFGVISLQTHTDNYFTQLGLDTNQNALWIRSVNGTSSFGSWEQLASRDWVNSQNFLTGSASFLPLTGGTLTGGLTVSATFPFLDFVDTNSFADSNDRFRIRAGGDNGQVQWFDHSENALTNIMTFLPTGVVEVPGLIKIGTGVNLSESTDRSDLLYINSNTSSWGGLQVGNTSNEFIFSLMGNGNAGGIHDDQNGDWIIYWDENAGAYLYYNGSQRLLTVPDGVNITGRLYASSGIEVPYGAGEHRPMVVLNGATNYGLFHTEAANDKFTFDFNGDQKFQFSQDGVFTINGNTITTGKVTNWDTAHGWGNHADEGYLTSLPSHNHDGRYMLLGGDGGGFDALEGLLDSVVLSFTDYETAPYPNVNIVTTYGSHYGGRAAQVFHGDTPDGGMWWRARQGDAVGWHPWQKVWTSNEFSDDDVARGLTAHSWGNHASAGYATETYVNTAVSNLVDSSPAALDTLNELAAALGDDANFSTTVTNSLAGKLSTAGGKISRNGMLDVIPASYSYANGSHLELFTTDNHVPAIGFHRGGVSATTLYEEQGELFITKWDGSGAALKLWNEGDFDFQDFALSSAVPTNNNQLTNGAGYITGVNWQGVGSGTRQNYDLRFQPSTTGGYAGFQFIKYDGDNAGYLLVKGTENNDVYTANGITLVADAGWLTLAQRYSEAGVRIMTGATSTERLIVRNDGSVAINPTSAWNSTNAALTVGSGGDGRIQVRHIYGKRADNDNADHLWLNHQNTGKHVQIGDNAGGNNLYVSGNIYMNGYFTGNKVATESYAAGAAEAVNLRIEEELLPLIDGKLDATAKAADSEAVDGIDSSRIVYGANERRSTRYDQEGIVSPNQNSGFYYGYHPEGAPFTEWWNWLTVAGASWTNGNNYDFKLAHNFHGDDFYVSRMTNGEQFDWRRIWDSGNFDPATKADVGHTHSTFSNEVEVRNWLSINKTGSATTSQEGGIRWEYNGTAQYYFYTDNANNGDLRLQAASLSGETDNAPRLIIPRTNKNIYLAVSGGNVGIGNTDPDALLDVGASLHQGATGVDIAAGAGGANVIGLTTALNHNWLPFTDGVNYYSAVQHVFRNESHDTDFLFIGSDGSVYPALDRQQFLGRETNRWQIVFCEILDSAGQHEKNLQNPEGEKSVGEYETGTVLVWKGGKNVPCTEYADHMRMGIAVKGIDSPLIQGAEPVLVTGPVNEGDYLVTSRKEGHAEAMSPEMMRQQNLFDCVIGKALESGEGESYLIKTWINI